MRTYRLEWRTGGGPARCAVFRSVTLVGEAAVASAAVALAKDQARDGEFRLARLDGDGRSVGPKLQLDLVGVAAWADDPAGVVASMDTAWARELADAGGRRRTTAAVRRALVNAGAAGLLAREQVADLLSILEQAYDRLGPSSHRLPA